MQKARSSIAFTILILSGILAGCKTPAEDGELMMLFQDESLVIAYNKDWLYNGLIPLDGKISRENNLEGVVRLKSSEPSCWDFGDISWISEADSNPVCGVYKIIVTHELSKSNFWADVEAIGQPSHQTPFGRIYVEDGMLRCYRFYLTDGSYFEFKDRNMAMKCEFHEDV